MEMGNSWGEAILKIALYPLQRGCFVQNQEKKGGGYCSEPFTSAVTLSSIPFK